MDPNVSIPETWAEHSNRNIQESQSSTNFVILNSLMPVQCGQTKASREFLITYCSKMFDYLTIQQKGFHFYKKKIQFKRLKKQKTTFYKVKSIGFGTLR